MNWLTEKRKISELIPAKYNPRQLSDKQESNLNDSLVFVRGAFYICMSSSELHTLHKAFTSAGGHWQTYIIWAKDNFTLSRIDYHHQMEPILYGFDESFDLESEPILYGWVDEHKWHGGRKQGNVWQIKRPKKSELHPIMKPVELCTKAIINSSERDNRVLDLFLGSGSTLIACEKTDRVCYGMELDPQYVDVIIKRYENFTNSKVSKL